MEAKANSLKERGNVRRAILIMKRGQLAYIDKKLLKVSY